MDKKIIIMLLLLVGAGAVYFKFQQGQQAAQPQQVQPQTEFQPFPQTDTPPPVEPPKTEEVLKEVSSYDEAVSLAKKHHRPIFLYFGAEWCHWCKKMKSETLSDAEVKAKLGKEYVVCFIDTDQDKATARKYRVSGIPAYMVVSESETVVVRDSGYKSKSEFLAWLRPKTVSKLEDKP